MTETFSNLTTSIDPRPMNNGGLRQRKIDTIVVHHNATKNKYVALNTWTVDAGIGTSAHYEITDTEIIGVLGENYIAFHAGGTGWPDVPKISDPNGRSIGLEHVNSTGKPTWQVSEATLRNSARLVADICKRYGLPINRDTIKLHREITSTACPGGLDIDKLVAYAKQEAGQSKPQPQQPVVKKGDEEMLLFKSDKATKYGKAEAVYLLAGNKVFSIESINSFNEMKSQGVPFTTLTIRNTEQIINAFGGVQ